LEKKAAKKEGSAKEGRRHKELNREWLRRGGSEGKDRKLSEDWGTTRLSREGTNKGRGTPAESFRCRIKATLRRRM